MARKFWSIFAKIFLWNLIGIFAQKENDGIVSFQTADPMAEIQHLVTHKGQIYAGATNHLFQLDSGLNLLADVLTGPKLDNPMCNAKGDCLQSNRAALLMPGSPNSTKVETPNVNKILLPFEDPKLLIACGTLLQGICQLHRLEDIRKSVANDDLVPVAANMHNASTVGFIGPGPEGNPVLYVGATHSYHWYRDHFPAVAMRKLDEGNMFHLEVPVDIEGQSAMILRSDIRDENLIRYVGGFVHEGFAYWALVQKKDHADRNSRYVTKLGRVCTKHSRFESYSEIPLSCTAGDMTRYDLLQAIFVGRMGAKIRSNLPSEYHAENHPEMEFLVGVFARGDDPAKPQTQSAVCVYPLKQIRAAFQVNIERCNQGAGTKNLPWFAGVAPVCSKQYETIPEDSCIAMRVSGLLDETATPVLTYDNQLLTAVTMTVTPQEDTVLFFGTADGRLKKVLLKSLRDSGSNGELAIEYANISLGLGYPISQDLLLSDDGSYLVAAAKNRIFKVPVSACERHKECATCLQSGDPFCGWCTLEAKCSIKSNCAQPSWASVTNNGQCPKITAMEPMNASIATPMASEVRIMVNFLPSLDLAGSYQCVFGEDAYVEAQITGENSLKCHLPRETSRPKIPDGQDHIAVPLKVWATATRQTVFEDQFIFYDCSAHRLCTRCLQSRWPCNWCLTESHCVEDRNQCANQDSERIPLSLCPHIKQGEVEDLSIPNGVETAIAVPVGNMDKINQSHLNVKCTMKIEDVTVHRDGKLSPDGKMVECEKYKYSYEANSPNQTAEFSLMLNGAALIDTVQLKLYKCSELAADCSKCLTLDPIFHCHWCGGWCQHESLCPPTPDAAVIRRASSDAICPAPKIVEIFPLAGPVEGGTTVTIIGHDLGTSQNEVDGRVFVAGSLCKVVVYEVSKRIVCVTEPLGNRINYEGPVEVMVGSGSRRAKSAQIFRFLQPKIFTFSPPYGPKSGGTRITIHGENLDAATNISAVVGNLPCAIDRSKISSKELQCVTSAAPRSNLNMDGIIVRMDNANITHRAPFTYLFDPVITAIRPLETIRSGGRKLLVTGEGFKTVQNPLMYMVGADGVVESETTVCVALNETAMICPSPALKDGNLALRSKRIIEPEIAPCKFATSGSRKIQQELVDFERLGIGFRMDAVESVQNLGDRFRISVVPDPILCEFPNGRRTFQESGLVIPGQRLNLAAAAADVEVWVGSEPCNITLLTPDQILCDPPNRPPDSDDDPPVRVRIGNLEFPVGRLAYDGAEKLRAAGTMPPVVLIAIAVITVLVLGAVGLAVGIFWRRKTTQAEAEYKKIQLQMDSLESSVRQECKQAFAELQADMSDFTTELVPVPSIPFNKRGVYGAKVMFKEDHSVMMDYHSFSNGYATPIPPALTQFQSLLWQPAFVRCLVGTLEQQPAVSLQDRVYIASLLTACLVRDMQYLTEITFLLLRELINRSVATKHPQLMLRRTESVVEKLLANWIALCFYDHLAEKPAGCTLYFLFRALKHQIEKGPVDAITSDARYSLSEDRLLKEKIDAEPVLLYVIPPTAADLADRQEKSTCRVLDCDSVGQVKSKILDCVYAKKPYGQRPTVHDVDLEWRSPAGPRMLDDEDRTSPVPGRDGWRRLNTLKHYGISGSAAVALIPKHRPTTMARNGTMTLDRCSNTYASIGSGTLLLSRRSSPENSEHGGVRYWHLVKPEDTTYRESAGRIPEIYLTRLLASKGTVQKFVDDFFRSALAVNPTGTFPNALKFLFDWLDAEAQRHHVTDAQVVQAWKNNALLLRFWVNLMKNPDFLLDVEKSVAIDSCLSVVAQTFMDACSQSELRLGKDSPVNKLLFARELGQYRQWVANFFAGVENLPPVNSQQLHADMNRLSSSFVNEFNSMNATRELYAYAVKYGQAVLEALASDADACRLNLAERLDVIFNQDGMV